MKANWQSAASMTNDLMHGLFSPEYLASHTMARGNTEKEALPPSLVDLIISE